MIRDATHSMETYPIPPSSTGIRTIGFQDIRNAQALGYIQVTPYIPGQGRHMLRGSGLDSHDAVMDLLFPESLLYEPHSGTPGGWRLGAPMYVIPYGQTTNPPGGTTGGIPPEGFPENEDAWHYHNNLCVWGWNGSGYYPGGRERPAGRLPLPPR